MRRSRRGAPSRVASNNRARGRRKRGVTSDKFLICASLNKPGKRVLSYPSTGSDFQSQNGHSLLIQDRRTNEKRKKRSKRAMPSSAIDDRRESRRRERRTREMKSKDERKRTTTSSIPSIDGSVCGDHQSDQNLAALGPSAPPPPIRVPHILVRNCRFALACHVACGHRLCSDIIRHSTAEPRLDMDASLPSNTCLTRNEQVINRFIQSRPSTNMYSRTRSRDDFWRLCGSTSLGPLTSGNWQHSTLTNLHPLHLWTASSEARFPRRTSLHG